MNIDKKTIEKLCKLSQLKLNSTEEEWYKSELQKILNYVEMLKDFKGDQSIEQNITEFVALRDDVEEKTMNLESVLEKAPEVDGTMFIVPRVIGSE